ncbi:hypothetical protein LR48_Vigan08g076300 [Vigna angularis]|uniref:Uncharacterized protein n=1 Tax=Phaseolus angularis TaxID=3914 RepID=A0A0L9V4K6_PHAAN|nr:hypothetical protein LR48_Vigan08g076300 [Vigna angularis]
MPPRGEKCVSVLKPSRDTNHRTCKSLNRSKIKSKPNNVGGQRPHLGQLGELARLLALRAPQRGPKHGATIEVWSSAPLEWRSALLFLGSTAQWQKNVVLDFEKGLKGVTAREDCSCC